MCVGWTWTTWGMDLDLNCGMDLDLDCGMDLPSVAFASVHVAAREHQEQELFPCCLVPGHHLYVTVRDFLSLPLPYQPAANWLLYMMMVIIIIRFDSWKVTFKKGNFIHFS